MEWCANAAHKVFDTWSEPGTQLGSEGNHAQHMFDPIPNPQGRVLHVVVHQYEQLVSPELMSEVFSAYGKVEEMFHSPHQHSPTHTSSIFIEYAHARMADDALHGLHGLYLYRDDCRLEIRHANSSELQAFYGYFAPSFSEHQIELLQQLQNDLQALSRDVTCSLLDVRMGTNLEPTPPTQNNVSAVISPIFACESVFTEDKQVERRCTNQEKQLKHAPVQLPVDLESLLLPAISILAEDANEEANIDTCDHVVQQWPPPIEEVHHQDSRDAPVTMPTVVFNVEGVEEESSNLQIAHFNCKIIHLPCSPLSDWSRWISVSSLALCGILSQMQVLGLVPCSSNVHEPSTNISGLCGHIKINRLMLTWDPGTLHYTHWEVSKPINKEKFSCLQLVLLWVTMNYTVIHPTSLICLCTSLPGEDSGEIHALKLTVHVWSYSVVDIHIQAIQFSDMRQTPEIYEKHLVQNFKLNMVRPTIMISHQHETLPQVGANEHWQTLTWNTEIRVAFLVPLTNGSPNVRLRLPWDPGVQHSQLGSSAQMMLRKLLQASREYQFNIPCTVMLTIKHEVSDWMSNNNKNSICPVLLSQGLKAASVGHTRRYDCSNNIYLAILTVRSYFSTNSEMKLLLDISSLKECHTVLYFYILQLSYMNLCCCEHHLLMQPHEHLLKMVISTYLPKHILTRITKASFLVDVLIFLLCKTISTCWLTSYYTRVTYASQYCPQGLVVWKIRFTWPPELIAINYSLFGSILVPSFASHALSPKKFQLSCPSGKLPPQSDTLLFACTIKIDFYKDSEATLQVRVRSSINIEHCQLKKSCADDSCTLSYTLCDATATKDTIIGGLLSSAEHYCKFHSAQIISTLHNSKTGIIAMIRSHGCSPKCEARLQWDPGANSAYFYSWLEIFRAVEKPMHITQVHTQHQLHSRSIISLWEFSLEKDVQMQCNSGKNCKFNDLTLELYNSWFTILHYCKSFQICKESQVVGRRIMMHLSFIFHIGNITPTHYYEVHLVFKADQCHQAKGTQDTWDSGISFYRTLQPDSDTHYMAFTWTGNSATHGLVGFYLMKFSYMLHLQTLGWEPKLWMISFMPP